MSCVLQYIATSGASFLLPPLELDLVPQCISASAIVHAQDSMHFSLEMIVLSVSVHKVIGNSLSGVAIGMTKSCDDAIP